MVPSNSRYSNYNDYDAQGIIIQELRLASRVYSIPVVSITQNTRGSENMSQQMDNSLIGDSYKKVRYSDYVNYERLILVIICREFREFRGSLNRKTR